MEIQVPVKYNDIQLTEGDKMIAAFLLMIVERYGFDYYYTINAHDFRKIWSGRASRLSNDSKCLEGLREHMNIVALDEYNWAIKFKVDVLKEWKSDRGYKHIRRTKYELQDHRNIMVWCYLMGQWNSIKEIVSDNLTEILPWKEAIGTLEGLEHSNFKVDRDS